MEEEYPESKLSPQDMDMLWEMEQKVEVINCYTDLLARIERKRNESLLRF